MKNIFPKTAALSLVFLLTLFTLAPLSVIAQNTSDQTSKITISPVTFNLAANPGDVLRQSIKIRNDSTMTQTLEMNAENFTATDEQGTIGLTEEETPFSLASWVKFSSPNLTLKSGQEVTVPFTITVPRNAEPGGHYASVFGQLSPDASAIGGGAGTALGQKVGALILLRVAGDVKEDAEIATFTVDGFQAGEDVPFAIRVQNRGSVHIRPQGFISITDMFGNKVADVQIEERNVFPGAVRRVEATWDKPGFMGYYTANALMQYGQNNQQITATTTFWIIPWKQIAIWGGAALVVIIILFLARKRIGRAFKALASGG